MWKTSCNAKTVGVLSACTRYTAVPEVRIDYAEHELKKDGTASKFPKKGYADIAIYVLGVDTETYVRGVVGAAAPLALIELKHLGVDVAYFGNVKLFKSKMRKNDGDFCKQHAIDHEDNSVGEVLRVWREHVIAPPASVWDAVVSTGQRKHTVRAYLTCDQPDTKGSVGPHRSAVTQLRGYADALVAQGYARPVTLVLCLAVDTVVALPASAPASAPTAAGPAHASKVADSVKDSVKDSYDLIDALTADFARLDVAPAAPAP